jgi:two-component system CheB/CheR fusion protein
VNKQEKNVAPGQGTGEFEALLEFLKLNRGFDFTGYKSASVMRRVAKRMQAVGIETYSDYLDYLEVRPEEFSHLFNTILINVTAFFRDPLSWDFLSAEIIPRIIAQKGSEEPIRIWCAGCASGEEAYTLAMVFAEALGLEQFHERVKIYATDIDEEALNQARQASYSHKELAGIPPDLLEKYFERSTRRFVFLKELRRALIFGRHDLIHDAPISRVDLLTCRNALMYFNSETQSKILSRMHFALNDDGFLFLGKAEMLFTQASIFTPVDVRRRIFAKVAKGNIVRERLLTVAQAGNEDIVNRLQNSNVRMREAAFEAGMVAQVVVDMNGSLILINEQIREMFSLSLLDLGRPLQDLELSYRPVELRSSIEKAHKERRTVALKDVEWRRGEDRFFLDIEVIPLFDTSTNLFGTMITFTDITRFRELQDEVEETNQELEAAYEELQSTSEELETTNEELQSTVEELETTNEELQSTNEELETMNEEVQSTNEELQTINDELRLRSEELGQLNSFMTSILASLHGGVVVINSDMQVRSWNLQSEDLWGLRADEVQGKHFLNLDIGLPVEQLKHAIRASLSGDQEHADTVVQATNRRGRSIRCKVTCTPITGADKTPDGVILVMEELSE